MGIETLNSRVHRPFFLDDLRSILAKLGCQIFIVSEPLDCVRDGLCLMLHEQAVYDEYNLVDGDEISVQDIQWAERRLAAVPFV